MPLAIDRHVRIWGAGRKHGKLRVTSQRDGVEIQNECAIDSAVRFTGENVWMNYIAGVVTVYREAAIPIQGLDLYIESNLPSGAGLSSSAALETATALAIEAVAGIDLDPRRRAQLCRKAEHAYAGVPCGIMDQMAVGLAQEDHVMLLNCHDETFEHVPFPDKLAILVCDTGLKHALGDGEYRRRKEECEEALELLGESEWRHASQGKVQTYAEARKLPSILARRAMHVVTEMQRVHSMEKALRVKDRSSMRAIMHAGHQSLRRNFEVSCEELDVLVEAAYGDEFSDVLAGARMTGGGFGGATVNLVSRDQIDRFRAHLEQTFFDAFGRQLNCHLVRPSGPATCQTIHLSSP